MTPFYLNFDSQINARRLCRLLRQQELEQNPFQEQTGIQAPCRRVLMVCFASLLRLQILVSVS